MNLMPQTLPGQPTVHTQLLRRLGFILGALAGCGLLYGCRRFLQHLEQRVLRRSVRSQVVGHVPQGGTTELGQVLEKVSLAMMDCRVDGADGS